MRHDSVRDGIHLHTPFFRPNPITNHCLFSIERSPYGWASAALEINAGMSELARDGYFLVFQDIRGRYQSEGQFVIQRPVRNSKDARSIRRGHRYLRHHRLATEEYPRNNGKAGIMGISYGGWLTEMALIEPHPALKAASNKPRPPTCFWATTFITTARSA